ncbi:MAG: D-alanyl-D-alanine carboxypeptidase family protein [Bacillota bacterium]
MFKRLCAALATLVLVLALTPTFALAETIDLESISVKHIIVIDEDSGATLLEKDADSKAYPASTTKIMTALVALENGNLDDEVTVGEEVWRGFGDKSSLMGLSEGEKITLKDLLYGMLLVSGNDAGAAIAVHIGGSISGFVDMMNQKAQELGMTGTHYMNPHGLHDEEHYTTARDMAVLARAAMQNETFRKIVGTKTYEVKPTNRDSDGYQLETSNKLRYTHEGKQSYEYPYATGIKTGDTNQALRCLVASAEKDGVKLITVLLCDEDQDNRFTVAKNLFDWCFANCLKVDASTLGLPTTVDQTVSNASFEDPQNGVLTLNADLTGKTISGLKEEIEDIKANIASVKLVPVLNDKLAAPVAEGQVVGTVAYQYNGSTLFSADLVASRSVAGIDTAVLSPSSSPLITGTNAPKNNSSPLLFWILVILLVVIIFCVIKIAQRKRQRRRGARRRRMASSRGGYKR